MIYLFKILILGFIFVSAYIILSVLPSPDKMDSLVDRADQLATRVEQFEQMGVSQKLSKDKVAAMETTLVDLMLSTAQMTGSAAFNASLCGEDGHKQELKERKALLNKDQWQTYKREFDIGWKEAKAIHQKYNFPDAATYCKNRPATPSSP